jgi:hypothetical protein
MTKSKGYLMAIDFPGARRGATPRFAFAAALCMILCLAESTQATDCTAVNGIPPSRATSTDCTAGQPCAPNACIDCPDGVCAAGCGKITTCVIDGSDPPISSIEWHESGTEGFPAPAGFTSGKCPPPDDSGNINCPTESSGGLPIR